MKPQLGISCHSAFLGKGLAIKMWSGPASGNCPTGLSCSLRHQRVGEFIPPSHGEIVLLRGIYRELYQSASCCLVLLLSKPMYKEVHTYIGIPN